MGAPSSSPGTDTSVPSRVTLASWDLRGWLVSQGPRGNRALQGSAFLASR